MKIGHLQKVSLIDYPGKISAIVFTQGCNFRCPYCHNPELVDPARYGPCLPEEVIFSYLEKRRGKLEGVVITGGEPTIQGDLAPFLRTVKDMGYLVKLDTNGSRPERLAELLEAGLIDYLAMDIKAPLRKYTSVTGTPGSGQTIKQSIALIMAAHISCEFRTTIAGSQLSAADLLRIGQLIPGAPLYALQMARQGKALEAQFLHTPVQGDDFTSLKNVLQKSIKKVIIR